MPLSEEEQRLLEQMEQALTTEDPKFASALRGSAMRSRSRRRAGYAAIGFLVGVALLMTGAILQQTVVAVVGFLSMLGAAYLFVGQWRRSTSGAETPTSTPAPRTVARGRASAGGDTFMDRMEERWRRRRDDTTDGS